MCNKITYNPAKATCCGGQNITEGLSENMSKCCGLKAYNPINEICCKSNLHAKISANTTCCDKDPFEEDMHLCCGTENNQKRMTRLSSDHRCCIGRGLKGQYNRKLECCCEKEYPLVQFKVAEGKCCVKNISSPSSQSTDGKSKADLGYFENPKEGNLGTNETKCTNGNRVETYFEQDGFECCGHYYYNTSLWSCCNKRLIPRNKHGWSFIFAGSNICV
ncbi:galaxin-2 [Austrofundulus limnaeus]|uniref:Galaxin-2 n=1 Tax=Austrofundulus limnaeus TaxID=52670 RepID=A0A2I4AYS4_AUSLI|nr:PREDICTED: galaxin-2-like [Austrofundulus limnaeus]